MKSFFAMTALLLFASCAQTQNAGNRIPVGSTEKSTAKEAVATFAEGCFWHTEIVFQSLEGVRDAVSGYAGGTDTHPDYEKVSTGNTGHAESVNVYYDPARISFQTLIRAFFASHDPTQADGQGNDIGTQYRSIAFYRTPEEKKIIEDEIHRLADSKAYNGKIVTEVKPFAKFYTAEDYHQEYIANHPDNPYVSHVSIPDFQRFRRSFKEGKFKS